MTLIRHSFKFNINIWLKLWLSSALRPYNIQVIIQQTVQDLKHVQAIHMYACIHVQSTFFISQLILLVLPITSIHFVDDNKLISLSIFCPSTWVAGFHLWPAWRPCSRMHLFHFHEYSLQLLLTDISLFSCLHTYIISSRVSLIKDAKSKSLRIIRNVLWHWSLQSSYSKIYIYPSPIRNIKWILH